MLAVHHLVLPVVHYAGRQLVWRVTFLSRSSRLDLIDSLPLVAARLARPPKVEFDVVHKVCRVREAVVANVATRAVRQNVAHALVKALFVLLLLKGGHSILRTAGLSIPDKSNGENGQ